MKSALCVEGKHSTIQLYYHPLGSHPGEEKCCLAGLEESQDSLGQLDLLWHSFCFTYFLHGRVRLFICLSVCLFIYLSVHPSIHSFTNSQRKHRIMPWQHLTPEVRESLSLVTAYHLMYESTEMFKSVHFSDGHSSFRRQTFAFTEYVIFHTTWSFLLPFTVLAPVKGHHCCCIKSQFLIAGL